MRQKHIFILFAFFVCCSMISCNRIHKSETPGEEFAEYIKAYTGSIVSENSHIRIELSSKPESWTQNSDDLFKFSPSIKGQTEWLSSDIVEFIPEAGSLKAGQTYKGTFYLGKVVKVHDDKVKDFSFSFKVAEKKVRLELKDVNISSDNSDKVSAQGYIYLSESIDKESFFQMINCSEDCNISISESGNDGKCYLFDISGIKRTEKDREITISLKGNLGYKAKNSLTIQIPSSRGFKIIRTSLEDGDDPFINVVFSQPLNPQQNLAGIVELEGVGRYYTKIVDNKLRIYFDSPSDIVLLNINQQIKSQEDIQLSSNWGEEFRAKENKPQVKIPLKGTILPNSKNLILPFSAVNLKAVDLKIIKIYESNMLSFLQVNELDEASELRRSGRLIYKRCIKLDSDPSKDLHEWQDFSVNLSNLIKQEPGALYRIQLSFKQEYSIYGQDYVSEGSLQSNQMRIFETENISEEENSIWDIPSPYYWDNGEYDWNVFRYSEVNDPTKPSYYMGSDKFPTVNLMTSEIGLTAQYSGNNKLFVAANDFLSAKPVFGVDLYVYDYQLKKIGIGRTDSEGLAEIEISGKPFALVAKRNSSTTYLKITEGYQKSLSRFDVGGQVLEKGLKAYIYGERGIWRPADTLHLTMIVHSKGKAIPDDHPATMELYTPKGQFHSRLISNGQDGFYSFAVPTSENDPTGTWNANFKIGGATFHKALRIETIKPNRLKINTNFSADILQAGKKEPVGITSTWLSGPAAAGLTTKINMTLRPGATTFKGFEGYIFKNPTIEFEDQSKELIKTELDENGKADIGITIPDTKGAPGLLEATILTTVEEKGGDASYMSTTLPLSPFSAYVGVKIPDEELETDIDHKFKVAVVDCFGSRVKGHKIEYSIYKIEWSWWWGNNANKFSSYINSKKSILEKSGKFISTDKDFTIPFRIDYPNWGRYLIYIKDLDSGHATGGMFTIDWPDYRGRSEKSDPDALTMITFSTDKHSYKIKEEATVYIPAAADGYALVSIENSSTVLSRNWVKTKANAETPFKFTVTEQMAPNCYIHITLIQPHGNTTNDLPIRLYGVQPITIEDDALMLEPKITMPDIIRPEEKFTIKVSEKKGKTMTYTLAIVDEGLLDLTNFKTPNPQWEFNKREALGVDTWDVYDNVIGAYSGKFSPMLSIGGDQSLTTGAKKDNRFNPVVRCYGPFTLKSGTNTHTVELPMYIGSVRVMVVASHEGASGNAEKTVPVKSELMILSSLPRVLSTEDKITLPVNVFAMTEDVKDVKVRIKVEGPLKIEGVSEKALSFKKPGDKLTGFNLSSNGEGIAKIHITAESGKYKSYESISIEVRDASPVVTNSVSKLIQAGKAYKFQNITGNNARLSLVSFPSFSFDKAYDFVERYRYCCSEQFAARGIFIVNSLNQLSAKDTQKARALIPVILSELYSRQLADGGFAYFPGQTESHSWVSSMAGQFLIQASSLGFDVDKGVIRNWKSYQTKKAQNYKSSDNDLDQAYRLYTLALALSPNNAAMNRMKESGNISIQARMMLACTYSICGKSKIAEDLLKVKSSAENMTKSAYGQTFSSLVRDNAITLQAYCLAGEIEEALRLANEISRVFENGYSTQELAFAATAFNRLANKLNSSEMRFAINSEAETVTVHSSFSKEIKCPDGEITVKNTSEGPIYASVTTTGKANGTKDSEPKGLKMSIRYQLPNGESVNPLSIKQGTDFVAIIKVQSTTLAEDYDRVVLKYVIPSGWEISQIKERFVSAQNAFDYNDIRDDSSIWYFSLDRGSSKTFKINLRAAYEGEYNMPSSICEDMYNSNIRAVSASGVAKVTK